MGRSPQERLFDMLMLPHLDAAYNVAYWVTRNKDAASDVTQEAFAKALQFFDSYRGENPRGWLLAIVRNTGLNWLSKAKSQKISPLSDEEEKNSDALIDETMDIELQYMQKEAANTLDQLILALPLTYREVVVLREIEELSYKDIAAVIGLPIGTVMSRLARARQILQKHWKNLPENRRQS